MSSHVSCFLYTLFSRLFGALFAYLFTRLPKIYLAPKTFYKFAQLPPESTARPSLKWPNEPAWRQQRSSIARSSVTPPPPTPTHLIQPPFCKCLVSAKTVRNPCDALLYRHASECMRGQVEWNTSGMRVWNMWMASSAQSNKLQRKLLKSSSKSAP